MLKITFDERKKMTVCEDGVLMMEMGKGKMMREHEDWILKMEMRERRR